MVVYVVTYSDWDSYSIEGIFSTREKAIRYMEKIRPEYRNYLGIELWEIDGSPIFEETNETP